MLRKKLLYNSTHRGCKEMDIILGNFARLHLNFLNNDELNTYNELLKLPDDTLYKIFTSFICAVDQHVEIRKLIEDSALPLEMHDNLVEICKKITKMQYFQH
jgi:succinate dehydrogenase flavin-adding protein (antitoxin of CptAB toxin-antitoxin module)